MLPAVAAHAEESCLTKDKTGMACTQTKKGGGGRGGFSSAGPRDSLLNRIGYMGNKNPDLSGPGK